MIRRAASVLDAAALMAGTLVTATPVAAPVSAKCFPDRYVLYTDANFVDSSPYRGCDDEPNLANQPAGTFPWETWNDRTSSTQVLAITNIRVRYYRDINYSVLLYTLFSGGSIASMGANNDTISSVFVDGCAGC